MKGPFFSYAGRGSKQPAGLRSKIQILGLAGNFILNMHVP